MLRFIDSCLVRSLNVASPFCLRGVLRYIDSCLVHEQNLDYCSGGNPHAYNCAGWVTTQVSGLTPQLAYSAWYFGAHHGKNITIDPAASIAPSAGSNPSCPWKLPPAKAANAELNLY
jgi:hypothetical protein